MTFTDYLLAAPFVIFFFGFCIFIHELGHFLVAKWRGLHIIAFSIGFKKVWGFKHKGVDYRIGCIPCGGYVDLPQIDATGDPKDENGNPLPKAKPIDKILTAVAGPLFNILFGIFLGTFVWVFGVQETTPNMSKIEVRNVYKYSPEYKAGLRDGDVIVAVNGDSFNSTWDDFVRKIFFTVGKVKLDILRGKEKLSIKYKPVANEIMTPREKIAYPFFSAVIPLQCNIVPGSLAEKAGMKTGDIITHVDGEKVSGLIEFDRILRKNRGEPFDFTIDRNGKIIEIKNVKPVLHATGKRQIGVGLGYVLNGIIDTVNIPKEIKSSTDANLFKVGDRIIKVGESPLGTTRTVGEIIYHSDQKPVEFLVERDGSEIPVSVWFPLDQDKKITTADLSISYSYNEDDLCASMIMPGSPAEKSGLEEYDKLVKINGKMITGAEMFIKEVNSSKGKPISLEIERDGKTYALEIIPEESYALDDLGIQMSWFAYPNPWKQFMNVIDMTYKSIRGIISKESTLKARHLSGPIGIFRGLAITYHRGGVMKALALLVLITYSLALLNLMPFPVLDGGHIVLALIEKVRGGKSLPARFIQPVFIIFILLLISMMLFVSFHDSMRMTSETKKYKFLPVSEKPSDVIDNQ